MRNLGSLMAVGQQLEIAYTVDVITRCCSALSGANHRGVIAPTRIWVSNRGDITIGDYDATQDDFRYVSPEIAIGVGQHRNVMHVDRIGRPQGYAWTYPLGNARGSPPICRRD